MRIAFFSDIHIRGNCICSETDFGAPSKWIAEKTKESLNEINPDYIFGLGDLTASGRKEDWKGYKKWTGELNAPVFDIFGNHDRDHTIFSSQETDYGKEYFTILGRVSDTKVVKIGNLVFILVSEEHNPECSKDHLTSTIPEKRIKFLESVLKEYTPENNVFVLNHCLPWGTTAFSNSWAFNGQSYWKVVSKKLLKLFMKYPLVAHITGHTHMDYRYKEVLKGTKDQLNRGKVGKFIDGRKYKDLPDVYFLNMPAADAAHGWVGSSLPSLQQFGKKVSSSYNSPLVKLYESLEEKGPGFFDFFYSSGLGNIWGRSAIYYFDIEPEERSVNIKTRWLAKESDVEKYNVKLKIPFKISSTKATIAETDLSLRSKKNLVIVRDDWFKIPARKTGWAEFSQAFSNPRIVKGIKIDSENLEKFLVKWKIKKKENSNWTKDWQKDPQEFGSVRAACFRVKFQAGSKSARVKNLYVV